MGRYITFLRRELDIGIVVSPAKIAGLTPQEHAATAGDISLLQNIDVRIAEK